MQYMAASKTGSYAAVASQKFCFLIEAKLFDDYTNEPP
jgi:hypothetical protein